MKTERVFLADTHCHLTENAFDRDRKQIIERALDQGIRWIVVPGMDIESSYQAVALTEEYPSVYAAVGVHPHHADTWNANSFRLLDDLAQSEKVVAIGEIGLDYYRNYSPRDSQLSAFTEQLALAAQASLPVIVHNREAADAVMHELKRWVMELDDSLQSKAGVLHAFSENLDVAREAIEIGFYIGIAGPISYKNSAKLQHAVSNVPLSKILTETDSPFLTPHPYRNRRNEPLNVIVVAEHLSRTIKRDYDTTVRITSQNAAELFGWKDGND